MTRDERITRNLGLAHHVAARWRIQGMEPDDIVQVAILGLIHAADRWRPDGGASFAVYAWHCISGFLRRAARDSPLVRRPSRGVPVEQPVTVSESEIDGDPWPATAPVEWDDTYDRLCECIEDALPHREASIAAMYWTTPMTLRQVGKRYGLTPERVRQIVRCARERVVARWEER